MDCWNANTLSQQLEKEGRRLGYMGHLIDILSAINSTISVSEEFRALILNSLTAANEDGSGESSTDAVVELWNQILQACEESLNVQNRLLADCDPNDRPDGLTGFPSIPDESENDTEDFSNNFNPSMQ